MDNKIVNYVCAVLVLIAAGCKNNTSTNKNNTTTDSSKTEVKSAAPKDSTHLVGVWLDQEIKTEKGEQIAYELVTQGEKTYIQVITFTGKKLNVNDNPDISSSASEIKKNGDKYVNPKNQSESYLMEKKTGNLLIYDETGLVAVCKRLL